MAWKWESARQIRSSGKAWLELGSFRKKASFSFARNAAHPVYELRGPVDSLPRNVPGALLLTLDIDCKFAAKDIVSWIEKRIANDPIFKATPKKKAGRRNDYKTWLFQLAMVRLHHAGKTPAQIASIAKKHWPDKPAVPEDIHSWRRDTMTRLAAVKLNLDALNAINVVALRRRLARRKKIQSAP